MDDLISRQAAIDAIVNTPSEVQNKNIPLTNQYDGAAFRQIEILGILESLPSAQPATNCSEIPNGSDDTISRQAAIRWVKTECNPYGKPTLDFESGKKVIEHLEQMPSAKPEVIRCGQCKYAEVADKEDAQDGYTCQFHRGSIWFSGSYCSWAERRTDE